MTTSHDALAAHAELTGKCATHFYAASCGDGDVSPAPVPGRLREKWVASREPLPDLG